MSKVISVVNPRFHHMPSKFLDIHFDCVIQAHVVVIGHDLILGAPAHIHHFGLFQEVLRQVTKWQMGLDYPWAFDGSDIFQGVAMALGLKGLLLKGSRNVIQVWGIIICTV